MKIINVLFFLLISCSLLKAQDKLVDYNNQITKVKIIEITDKEIKFKKIDNIDGPLYTESKTNYATIIFENGNVEVLSKKNQYIVVKDKSNRPRHKLISDFKSNTLELDLFSFITKDVSIQYTRYLKNKKYAITIPVRMGWISNTYNGMYLIGQDLDFNENIYDSSGYYNFNRYTFRERSKPHGFKMLSGVNFKFFWRNTYKLRAYAAPELIFGYFQSKKSGYIYDSSSYIPKYYQTTYRQGTLGLMATVGMLAYANKIVNFKLELAAGFIGFLGKRDNFDSNYYFQPRVTGIGRMTFALGFNF